MLTVRIIYKDGTEDLKDCWSVDEISMINVLSVKVLRSERQ